MALWTIAHTMGNKPEQFYREGDRYYKTRNVVSAGENRGWNYEILEITAEEYQSLVDMQTMVTRGIEDTMNAQSKYAEGYNAAVTLMGVDAPTVALAEAMRPVLMEAVASLHDAEASVVPTLFPDWDGNSHEYKVGDRVRYGDTLYKCIQAHTSLSTWDPVHAPSLWARTDDPAIEWPEWVRPLGTHDAYAKGAKVSHNGKHWISNTPNNTWEPGVYGWDEVKE